MIYNDQEKRKSNLYVANIYNRLIIYILGSIFGLMPKRRLSKNSKTLN